MPIHHDEFILKPGIPKQLTQEQLYELLECSQDVKYFAKNFYTILHPIQGKMIIPLYDYQERLLDCFQGNKQVVLCSPRQAGKCCQFDTIVTIKDTITGEIIEKSIGEFYKEKLDVK